MRLDEPFKLEIIYFVCSFLRIGIIDYLVAIKLWHDSIPFRTRPSNAALPMVVVV